MTQLRHGRCFRSAMAVSPWLPRESAGQGEGAAVIEFFHLLGVAAENYRYRRALKRQERSELGGRSWYRALDRALAGAYRWSNPFALSKKAKRKLKQRLPLEDLVYGETPILTAWHILNKLAVDQADHVVELGGGRGIFSLTAVSAFGSEATMLEVVPSFVKKTRQIVAELGLERLSVQQSDILSAPLPEGTLYFVTATTFSDASWRALDRQLATASEGAKAVSLSLPLNRAYWKLESQATLPFSWGDNTVYFQTRLVSRPGNSEEPAEVQEAG